jgi:hypothetical protein
MKYPALCYLTASPDGLKIFLIRGTVLFSPFQTQKKELK